MAYSGCRVETCVRVEETRGSGLGKAVVVQKWVLEPERVRRASTLGSERMRRWPRETCVNVNW